MKVAVLIVAALTLSACSSSPEEEAHAWVKAHHYHAVEKICEPNGGVDRVHSYWCSGRGCSLNGNTRVTAVCKNSVTAILLLGN
jgi:hypothetical protein